MTLVSPSEVTTADRRIAVYLFLLTFFVYGYFWGGGGWNQNSVFDVTRAIVEQKTIAIDAFATNTGDLLLRDGHYYANKAPGLSLLAAVPYSILLLFERSRDIDPSAALPLSLNAYICSLLVCVLPGALIPSLLYGYGRRNLNLPPFWVLMVSLIVGFGSPLFPWATILILHVPSAAFSFLAFCELGAGGGRRRAIGAGAAAGMAGLMNYLCIPLGFVFLLWTNKQRGFRESIWFALGAFPFAGLFFWYQVAAFGSWLRNPVTMNEIFITKGAWMGMIQPPTLDAIVGVTISSYRGIFFFSPILLFSLAGAIILFRQGRRELVGLLVFCAGVFFLFNFCFNNWEGGFGAASRYVVPAVPFLGVFLLASRGLMRGLFAVLSTISIVNGFAVAAVDPQPHASLSAPLTQYIYPLLINGQFRTEFSPHPLWSPKFMRGHTGVVQQTLAEIVPFSRFPPGSEETKWASFNVGELIAGPGTLGSLVPVLAIFLIATVALAALARRMERRDQMPDASPRSLGPR